MLATAKPDPQRLRQLDGLRGVAILLVILFHAYARWPDLLPWATQSADFPLFRFGYLGVELFFFISGFVIFLTLESCQSFGAFLWRRWLRLFPAMLIATVLIFATAPLLAGRPAGVPQAASVLPGLLFLDPELIHRFADVHLAPIEGAFWSLFVEAKFYVIFGALFFVFRERTAGVFGLVYLAWRGLTQPGILPPGWIDAGVLTALTSGPYLGWFVVGAYVYRFHTHRRLPDFAKSLVFLGLCVTGEIGPQPGATVAVSLLFLLFVLGLFAPPAKRLLSWRPLLFLGFVSYPLYLIHENAMVAMTIKLHALVPGWPALLTPLPGLCLLISLSWLIARFGEPWLRGLIRRLFARAGATTA